MSTGSVAPFQLCGTTVIAGGTVATTGTLSAVGGDVALVTNLGTVAAWVAIGQAAAVNGAESSVVLPAAHRALNVSPYVKTVSAITSSGTASVVFEIGRGSVF